MSSPREGVNISESVLLLVEDEPLVARALLQIMRRYAQVYEAGSISDARKHLEANPDICGMVLDLGLPDGNGLALLEEQRRMRAFFPVLVYTGTSIDAASLNRIYELRAAPTAKPALDLVHRFAAEAAASARPEITEAVSGVADRYKLPLAERSALIAAVVSEPAQSFLARRAITGSTMRTQLERIARRVGASPQIFIDKVRYEVLRRRT